ncbi:MAG TPA: pyridoxal phosphate-dependent aminotransferase [Candidatus Binatia bacterium]|nr:pyridoxal phosphate-dependent aminotransferase [Candidatus Binatia bacterium]
MCSYMNLAKRLQLIKPSPTLMVTVQVAALRRQGIEVIDFGAGEPDFDTPDHIKEAAVAALRQGKTKYTPVGGTAELKEAIIAKLQRDNGLTYSLPEVTANCGGKHTLFNAFHALFGEGDEVLIPAPYWVSYSDMVILTGGQPKLLPTGEGTGFKITAAQLHEAIGPRSRALLLNSPSNPTGAAYTEDELRQIAEVIERSNLIVISDDVYEKFLYDSPRCAHLLALKPHLRDRVLLVNSVSKTYAMTGWRLGYAAGPREVISAIETLQSQSTSNPNSITQAAAVAALTGTQEPVGVMAREFAKRRDYVVRRLRAMPGISCTLPEGAFYVFPCVSAYFGAKWQDKTIASAMALSLYLLQEAKVALVAGEGFGSPDHVRISYATSMQNLEQGLDQIEAALKRLGSL